MLTKLDALENITPISTLKKPETAEKTVMNQVGESVFGSIFKNAIDNVKETDAEFTQAQYLLSTGQLDNPSAALIAYTKEEVAVNLLIQLRNRAMDVYSELTRMSF